MLVSGIQQSNSVFYTHTHTHTNIYIHTYIYLYIYIYILPSLDANKKPRVLTSQVNFNPGFHWVISKGLRGLWGLVAESFFTDCATFSQTKQVTPIACRQRGGMWAPVTVVQGGHIEQGRLRQWQMVGCRGESILWFISCVIVSWPHYLLELCPPHPYKDGKGMWVRQEK